MLFNEIVGEAVNHRDLKEMKFSYIINFVGESHFINLLTKELQKNEWKSFIANKYLTLFWKKYYIFFSICLTTHLTLEILRS